MQSTHSDPALSVRFSVAGVEIIRLLEIEFRSFEPSFLIPQWNASDTAAHLPWLVPECLTPDQTCLTVNVNTWIVRTPRHTILVDTGIGNDRVRRIPVFNQLDTPYLAHLQAAGVSPEDVDFVFCTHLHSDHVGWNTHLEGGVWRPTFANARYVFAEPELAVSQSEAFRTGYAAGVYEDSILPVLEAGLVQLVGPEGGEIVEHLRFIPTPGHTAGHMSIELNVQGQRALFTGDVMHNPIQVFQPQWNSVFCDLQDRARESRRWVLDYAAEHEALLLTAHFPRSSAGYVRRHGEQFEWRFA
jgi:glyoxylase-like metal-dependent hydrolase (beta-lactamase superfamily II)